VMGAYLVVVVVIGVLGAFWAKRLPDATGK
jgi:hypothetical protein